MAKRLHKVSSWEDISWGCILSSSFSKADDGRQIEAIPNQVVRASLSDVALHSAPHPISFGSSSQLGKGPKFGLQSVSWRLKAALRSWDGSRREGALHHRTW